MDCPGKQIKLPPVIVQDGDGPTVTVLLQMLLQPFASVTVRKYVPAALTVMQFVVAPVLHK